MPRTSKVGGFHDAALESEQALPSARQLYDYHHHSLTISYKPHYRKSNTHTSHKHGLSRQRQHRHLPNVRRREKGPATIRRQRVAKGAHPTMYELSLLHMSLSSSVLHLCFCSLCATIADQSHTAIHSLTDTCFRKCITGKISSGKLDRSEEPCMQNCVDRFMDANLVVIKNLEQMRTHM